MRRRDVIHACLASALNGDDVLVLHSELLALRTGPEGLRWDLLGALGALIDDGVTVAIPAVTFEFCRSGTYHYRDTPPETGILAQWALDWERTSRTPHPVYSFAVAGPRRDLLLNSASTGAFGSGSIFEIFEGLNTRIVMLGASWDCCTQVHRYEEYYEVPYRERKTFTGRADHGDGWEEVALELFVRDVALKSKLAFSRLLEATDVARRVRRQELFATRVESITCGDLAVAANSILEEDPFFLLSNAREVEHRLRQLHQPEVRIALAGSQNLAMLADATKHVSEQALNGRPCRVMHTEVGALGSQVFDAGSQLAGFEATTVCFCERLEDVLAIPDLNASIATEMVEEAVAGYCHIVAAWSAAGPGVTIVLSFPYPSAVAESRAAGMVRQANSLVRDMLAEVADVKVLDIRDLPAGDAAEVTDPRLWLVGRMPFSKDLGVRIATRVVAHTLETLGLSTRLVVVDLDNTLWQGEVGENGIEGIELGPDYPGNAHQRLQRLLKALRRRGMLLAVASKNDRDPATDALELHPGMILKPGDFVATEIGWTPKWQAVTQIAEALNLSLGNVMFIDDNPVERAEMRAFLPDVRVVELPPDPALFADVVASQPTLPVSPPTEADHQRTQDYRSRARRVSAQAQSANLKDFQASLRTRVTLEPLRKESLSRAAQLSQKTNQFNTTLRRYSATDLTQLAGDPQSAVALLNVEDRFSPAESLGLLVLKVEPARRRIIVDSYVLSCRAFGRGLETRVLSWLVGWAARRGMTEVVGLVVEGDRNQRSLQVFPDAGFARDPNDGAWIAKATSDACEPANVLEEVCLAEELLA